MMAQRKWLRKSLKPAFVLAAAASLAGGCGTAGERPYNDLNMRMQNMQQQLGAGTIKVGKQSVYQVPMTEADGKVWISLEHAARAVNMKVHSMRDGYAIGDTDAAYKVRMGDVNAVSGSRTVDLPDAPRSIGGQPCISSDSLTTLLETPVRWNAKTRELTVAPLQDSPKANTQRGITMQMTDPTGLRSGGSLLPFSTGSAQELLKLAKRFLGTPYDFGAGSYASTKKFDCSSFTQYVYGKFGVELPRTSREQSQMGRTVSESELQPGDLMFFYTPGRYDSNKVVGHVGIYAGNGKIVQTYGDPGVVVDDFNDYWKGRFLFGKRVLSS